MFDERAATGVNSLGSPRAVAFDEVSGRPILIVAKHVTHGAPQLPGPHCVVNPVDDWVEARVKADLGRQSRCADEVAHLSDLGKRRCQRLLTEQVLACRHGRQHQVTMGGGWRSDHHGVHIRMLDHLMGIRGHVEERTVPEDRLSGRLGRVGGRHGDNLTVVSQLPQSVGVDLTDHPATHQADPHRMLCHEDPTRGCIIPRAIRTGSLAL